MNGSLATAVFVLEYVLALETYVHLRAQRIYFFNSVLRVCTIFLLPMCEHSSFSILTFCFQPGDLYYRVYASSPHSGDWLQALPISSCGLRLADEAVRIGVGLRLGLPLMD